MNSGNGSTQHLFDATAWERPFYVGRHRWILNATRVLPQDLHPFLEAELAHYIRATLSAGDDPRDAHLPAAMRRRIPHEGSHKVIEHMRAGIRLACLAAEAYEVPLNVTVYGIRRRNSEDRVGDMLNLSISVSAKPDPDLEQEPEPEPLPESAPEPAPEPT
jgi:hypothetical protein